MADQQQMAREVVHAYLEKGDGVGWFEPFYALAAGNPAAIPWAKMGPRRELVEWAAESRPQGEGHSALVIGCGLGDDAEFLAELNYRVTAFDVSATAVEWCRERFPDSTVDYQVADLFDPPALWLDRFQVTVEAYIVQALPPAMRRDTVRACAAFVAPGGLLLAIGQGVEDPELRSGPPWPLTPGELALFEEAGLLRVGFKQDFNPDAAHQFRYRAEYRRKEAAL